MPVLKRIERTWQGAPTPEEIENDKKAIAHFLKYCDSAKCIRGSEHAKKANWHTDSFCIDCAFNPYNMKEEAAP